MESGNSLHLTTKTKAMKEQIVLSISTPCSEKWEEFTPVKDGAFCGTCSKTIIDFTKMSDEAILQFFAKKPLHACGRFHSDQLREYAYTTAPIQTGFPLLKAGLLSLVLFVSSKTLLANVISVKTQSEFVQDGNKQPETNVATSPSFVVNGVVKSKEDNQPMPGINVNLKGSEEMTNTDANGKFEFPRKLKDGDVLVFSFIGYKTQEVVVKNPHTEGVSISLEVDIEAMDEMIIMGEVRVSENPSPSRFHTVWMRIKSIF
jgi:hypothetical protein